MKLRLAVISGALLLLTAAAASWTLWYLQPFTHKAFANWLVQSRLTDDTVKGTWQFFSTQQLIGLENHVLRFNERLDQRDETIYFFAFDSDRVLAASMPIRFRTFVEGMRRNAMAFGQERIIYVDSKIKSERGSEWAKRRLSSLVPGALKDDDLFLRFIVGHELGHIVFWPTIGKLIGPSAGFRECNDLSRTR